MVRGPVDIARVDLLDVRDAQVGRIVRELAPEDLDGALDAVDAKYVRIHKAASQADLRFDKPDLVSGCITEHVAVGFLYLQPSRQGRGA